MAMLRINILPVVLFILAITSNLSAAVVYGAAVVDSSPVDPIGGAGVSTAVLGPPDGLVAQFDEVDATTFGFVTIDLGELVALGAGDDLTIHLIDRVDGEFFELLVSADGVNFLYAGLAPAEFGLPNEPISFSFDLNPTGLAAVQFVTIRNTNISPGPNEGPDIDAISVVPEPSNLVFAAISLLLFFVRNRAG